VKLLATNGAQRSAQAPNVPAIAELIPGFDFAPIVGVLAPAGTPQGIIDKVAAEVVALTKLPDAVQAMTVAGIEAVGGGPEAYAKAIADETARMAKAIAAAGLKPD
jgi:tripartite-type tricarboxylate transporter receptor subunit TctC